MILIRRHKNRLKHSFAYTLILNYFLPLPKRNTKFDEFSVLIPSFTQLPRIISGKHPSIPAKRARRWRGGITPMKYVPANRRNLPVASCYSTETINLFRGELTLKYGVNALGAIVHGGNGDRSLDTIHTIARYGWEGERGLWAGGLEG